MDQSESIQCARSVVFGVLKGGGLGMLSTADENGVPHATWMATFAATGDGNLIALTSETSRKVANIRSNPEVEWLFSGPDYKYLVYLRGVADVISDPVTLKQYWNLVEEKDRAYFLNYCSPGIGFCVVRTKVEGITLMSPEQKLTVDIDVASFWSD